MIFFLLPFFSSNKCIFSSSFNTLIGLPTLAFFRLTKLHNFFRPPNSGLVTWSRRLRQEPGIQVKIFPQIFNRQNHLKICIKQDHLKMRTKQNHMKMYSTQNTPWKYLQNITKALCIYKCLYCLIASVIWGPIKRIHWIGRWQVKCCGCFCCGVKNNILVEKHTLWAEHIHWQLQNFQLTQVLSIGDYTHINDQRFLVVKKPSDDVSSIKQGCFYEVICWLWEMKFYIFNFANMFQ